MTRQANNERIEAARRYLGMGYQPVAVPQGKKGPVTKGWQRLRVTEKDLARRFRGPGNVGVMLGEPSGWLVDLDLDCPEAVRLARTLLPPTPVVSGRPGNPSSHYWYIAKGAFTVQFRDPVTRKMIIEVRSTGSQTLVGPSVHPDDGDRYDDLIGTPSTFDADDLLDHVRAIADAVIRERGHTLPERPRLDGGSGGCHATSPPVPESELLRRAARYLAAIPSAVSGSGGHNQTYAAATAMVHGFGLDPEVAYRLLWQEYNPRCEPPWDEKELRHKVDDAANKRHERPYGWLRDQVRPSPLPRIPSPVARSMPAVSDPGPLTDDLLVVPGFISDVVEATLAAAPYPNRTMAFAGALALQGVLAGGVVRDGGDNRTNLYVLAVAHSGVGKDAPRKMNAEVLRAIGRSRWMAQQLASGEGVEDALRHDPNLLVQIDEFDTLLRAMNGARDARYESLMAILLSAHSSASSVMPVRLRAGQADCVPIERPSLVVFGTAIPNFFYSALSERTMTNGLFGRILVFEAGARGLGQDPKLLTVPDKVLVAAEYWRDQQKIPDLRLAPPVVPTSAEANAILADHRRRCERAYDTAEKANDAVATTLWARTAEHARKLALVYAVSSSHMNPEIDAPAVRWATQVADRLVCRMLFMASEHGAESPFDALARKVIRKIRSAPNLDIDRSTLLRSMKVESKVLDGVMNTLMERGDVVEDIIQTAGRSAHVYRMVNQGEESGKEEPTQMALESC